MGIRTLPQWAREWAVNASALKTFLRRNRPDLLRLGKPVGPARAYDEAAAAEIRQAFNARRKLDRVAVAK